jgi:hypothetical protein
MSEHRTSNTDDPISWAWLKYAIHIANSYVIDKLPDDTYYVYKDRMLAVYGITLLLPDNSAISINDEDKTAFLLRWG